MTTGRGTRDGRHQCLRILLRMFAGRRPWRPVLIPAAALLAAVVLPGQQQAAGRPAAVTVVASSEVAKLSGERLAASVAWLLREWYGPAVTGRAATGGTQTGVTAPTVTPAGGTPPNGTVHGGTPPNGTLHGGTPHGSAQLRLALTASERGLHLRSELVEHGHSLGVRNSWLPDGSLGAVTATAAGDGFLLWSEARGFPHLQDLATPPGRRALLPATGLSHLVQRPVAGADVQAAAVYPGGVLVLLADGPIALGHRFDIVPDTAAWLTWREGTQAAGAAWRDLHPLHDGRVVLEPWNGGPVVAAAEQAARGLAGASDLFAGHRSSAAPPGNLLAVAPDGTVAWRGSGEVFMLGLGGAGAGSVRMPLGSLAPAAIAADDGGALWAFDPRERRIRAFAATGDGDMRQIQAVTPLLPAQELGGVQALAVTADGQFLIGSQRAVWNVDRRGMPRWALRLLHERPRQRLPQAFTLAAGVQPGAFLLLDRSTGGVHRFTERPEPAAAPHLTAAAAPKPGAVAAALADSALHAAERAWQRRQPQAAALLLAVAGGALKRWHAADPLADGVGQRTSAIERLSESVEHALYGDPPLTAHITPGSYHPALGAYYKTKPFALTIRNGAHDRAPSQIELGIAGTAATTTVAVPSLAPREQVTLPVQIHAAPASGSTTVPRETTLWLSAAPDDDDAPVLSAMPLTVEPVHCPPAQAVETPAGDAHAAFLRWHLTVAAAARMPPVPAGLSAYRLADRVARLADVGTGGRCLQAADHTLATLSGGATDWALAVASLLHRRGTPAALLVADAAFAHAAGADVPQAGAAAVLVLAWFEHGEEAVDQAAAGLPPAALRQLAARLEGAQQAVPPGRVWALLPHSAAAGRGAVAWSRAGAEAAAAALAATAARIHVLTPAIDMDLQRRDVPVTPPVLPLGGAGYGAR